MELGWVPHDSGGIVFRPPERCRNEHTLGPNQMTLIWHGCLCATAKAGGHTGVRCNECGDVQLFPPCSEDE